MDNIPTHLLSQIKAGNVVLFLGAGASFGSVNGRGESIPSGQHLSDKIAEKFIGNEYLGKDLSYVSEVAISESSLLEVQNYIASIFKEFEPQPHHLKIPSFKWNSIFTTNYDLIVEKSYHKAGKKSLQEVVPVIKNTKAQNIFINDRSLPYYKIHGCITDINDSEAPLILTPDQFINHKSKRDRLFSKLKELSFDYPILFVGFGMADLDIRMILNNLDENMIARGRSYMVGPNITEPDQRMWDLKKISSIKMTFADFIEKIDQSIDKNSRVLAALKPQHALPIYGKFVVSVDELNPSENFQSFIQDDIEFIHPNLNSPNTNPKEFYRGYFENWDPIIKNLDINRKVKDGILFEAFVEDHDSNRQFFYLVTGNAGSGKSVLLKRLAFDAAITLERFCIFLKDINRIKADQIIELHTYVKDRIYLFIDNVALLENDIIYLLNRCRKENIRITIIGAERMNVWNMECQMLSSFLTEAYHIKYLHDTEISELLLLLEKHNCLGTLAGKSQKEKLEAFENRAARELLVALYEATTSKPFADIILDEYKSINDVRAQSLYLTVSIFHRLGAEARAGFISRVHNISFHEFKESLFKPLDQIVFDKKDKKINDFVYVTRNRMIAEIIFEKVIVTPQDRYDEYIRILQHINVDYESDRVAFLAITNARKLVKDFPDPQMIRKIYANAEKENEPDPKLLQQKAIFEMTSTGGNMEMANLYLKEAHKLLPKDLIIAHSFAELMLKKAERSKLVPEFFSSIEECIDICGNIISNNKQHTDSHPYHTSLKALILKLKYVLTTGDVPAIERNIKDIEKSFIQAKQIFPNEEFILEIESKFNEIINERENAKELLEKAFKINKASPFLALRLANFYEKENDPESAINVVKESLELNTGDKELNFKYGSLLEKTVEPNYESVKYYLRRSFTKGDSRFLAQLWYARALYITNNFTEAQEIFEVLSQLNLAAEIKRTPIGILKRDNRNLYFEGLITKAEISYGFIKRDSFGDSIYFYRFDEDNDWDKIRRGIRVSFKIGFNYRGPVAVSLKILN